MIVSTFNLLVSAEDSVYSISTSEEFKKFLCTKDNNFSNVIVRLENDIDVNDGNFSYNEEYRPLYNDAYKIPDMYPSLENFKGTFDGQGYTIKGLFTEYGLFKNCVDAEIKNVSIENSLVYSENAESVYMGAIASYAEKSVFTNCKVDSLVIGSAKYTGGAFGKIVSCDVSGIITLGDVYSSNTEENFGYCGGLAGFIIEGDINECGNQGSVTGNMCGGFVGMIDEAKVYTCYNTGDVNALSEKAGGFAYIIKPFDNGIEPTGSYGERVDTKPDRSIKCCYNAGNLNAKSAGKFCAELIGDFFELDDCYYVGQKLNEADSNGEIKRKNQEYLDSFQSDSGYTSAAYKPLILGVDYYSEEEMKVYPLKGFCTDAGNANNGYPVLLNYHDHVFASPKTRTVDNEIVCLCEGCPIALEENHVHAAGKVEVIQPTDETEGQIITYCKNCRMVISTEYVEKLSGRVVSDFSANGNTFLTGVVKSDYSASFTVPHGMTIDTSNVTGKITMTNIDTLGIDQTISYENTVQTGVEKEVKLDNYLPSFNSSIIKGRVNGVEYAFDLTSSDTTENYTLNLAPQNEESVRSAWTELASNFEITDTVKGNGELTLPQDAYIQIGTEKLVFNDDGPIYWMDEFEEKYEGEIRDLVHLEKVPELEDAQMEIFIPFGTNVDFGGKMIMTKDSTIIKIRGYKDSVDVNTILSKLRDSETNEELIKNLVLFGSDFLNSIDGETLTIDIECKCTPSDEWVVTREPTCEEIGWKARFCVMCGERVESERIPALGHKYTKTITNPTCKYEGYTTYTCTVCNDTYKADFVSKLEHQTIAMERKDPTCTENGMVNGTVCSVCGEIISAAETIPATGHTIVIDKAVAATCTKSGRTEGEHCSVCNEVIKWQKYVPALGHIEIVDEAINPTCTTTGLTEGKHCSVCNEIIVEQEVIAVLGHAEEVIKGYEATCLKGGLTDGIKCSVCDEILEEQEVVPAIGHNYQTVVVNPTCTEKGYTTYTCSVCGDAYVDDYVDVLGHTYGEWVIDVDATCTTKGSKHKVCEVCNDTAIETIDSLGHDEGVWKNTILPTCIDSGLDSLHCTRCDVVLETKEIDALEHKYIVSVTEPTCIDKGYTTYKCSVCNDIYVDDYVEALGHTYGEWIIDVDATCTTKGSKHKVCGVCNDTVIETIDSLGHIDGEWKNTTVPTCTEDGEDTNYCSVCKEAWKTKIAPAFGHKYHDTVTEPTCTEKGYTTFRCSNCNDEYIKNFVEAFGHADGEWEITIEPTYEKEGKKTLYCAVCGDVIKSELIEKLPSKVTGVTLNKTIAEINYKDTFALLPEIMMNGNIDYTVTYSSSNEEVATVDENGNVVGVMRGNATITCTVTDSNGNIFTNTCEVTVNFTIWQWILYIVFFGWIWM